jgi:hypothetical protein
MKGILPSLVGSLGSSCRYKRFKQGDYLNFFSMHCKQHRFICRPSDSTVSEDAGVELRTGATSALEVRRSNHSARSHRSHPPLGEISYTRDFYPALDALVSPVRNIFSSSPPTFSLNVCPHRPAP